MRRHLPLVAALVALAAPTVAHAGPRFKIADEGADPHVLVDPVDGTAHVVWNVNNTTMECNVPRGATSCTPQAVNMGLPADKMIAWIEELEQHGVARAPDQGGAARRRQRKGRDRERRSGKSRGEATWYQRSSEGGEKSGMMYRTLIRFQQE